MIQEKPERIEWIDIAKGGAIFLVVLLHSYLSMKSISYDNNYFKLINDALAKIRIPLFFFTSGIVTSIILNNNNYEFTRKKIIPIFLIYIIWTEIGYFFNMYLLNLYPQNPYQELPDVTMIFTKTQGNMWFVHALLVFNIIVLFLKNLPRNTPYYLMVFIIIFNQFIDEYTFPRLFHNLPFFLIGVYLYKAINKFIFHEESKNFQYYFMFFLIFISFSSMAIFFDFYDIKYYVTSFFVSLLGVILASMASDFFKRFKYINLIFSSMGRNSIGIFLNHQFFISIIFYIIKPFNIGNMSILHSSIIVAISASILSYITYMIAKKLGLGWIYAPPINKWYKEISNKIR